MSASYYSQSPTALSDGQKQAAVVEQGAWRGNIPGIGWSPAALTATIVAPGAVGALIGYALFKGKAGAIVGAVAGIVANQALWSAVFSNVGRMRFS